METPSDPRQKTARTRLFLKMLAGLLVLLVLLTLFLPAVGPYDPTPDFVRVRNTETWIVAAVQTFEAEYSHLPNIRSDGIYEDPASNAQLFAVLRALDRQRNPRGTIFLGEPQVREIKKHWWRDSKMTDGFDPATGVLLDLYGRPFKIRLGSELVEHATSPYRDLPASGKSVLVWSLGKDGKQGKEGDPQSYQGSDDIVSWE